MMPTDPHARVSMLETMILIRAHERVLAAHQGRPAAAGGEALAAALARWLGPRDTLVVDARRAGPLIARGALPDRLMAGALGRAGAYAARGAVRTEVAELDAVLAEDGGAAVAFAPAVAAAAPRFAVVVFGDGEVCDDVIAQSMTLAQQQRLPLLYLCEAGAWQSGAALAAERCGMAWRHVDGDDVEAIAAAGAQQIDALRGERAARLLVVGRAPAVTRAIDDGQAYVDAELLGEHAPRDAIALFSARLLDEGITSAGELMHLHQRCQASAEAALACARNAPAPGRRRWAAAIDA